jgi:peptidoglycan/xylan/chitin deacetylase (PgdA/CDA1 family)
MRHFSLFPGLTALLLLLSLPAQSAVVLQYHHISTETPFSTSTSPERFAMHLDYLDESGFEVVPLQHLVDTLRKGKPLPDKTAAITFDDGYVSIHDTAWPLLKEKGWPFTVFINTEPHDQRKPLFMSWDQLRQLAEDGATIANHTVSHPYLLQRQTGHGEAQWKAWVRQEISAAQHRIEMEIGTAPMLLAYPFGEFDSSILDVAEELGYAGFGQQSGPLASFSDLRVLPRFSFGGSYGDRQDFATKVNSLPMPLAAGADSIRWESAEEELLNDIVMYGGSARPRLILSMQGGFDFGRLNCFASGQGRIPLTIESPRVFVQAEKPFKTGRSRYNCTASSGQRGRFFWFSQLWIIR